MLSCIYVACIAYLVLQGDILPDLLHAFGPIKEGFFSSRTFLLSALSLFVIPLASVEKITALKASSLISMISVHFLAITVLIRCIEGQIAHTDFSQIVWFKADLSIFLALSLVVSSFFCQFNVLPLNHELKSPSRSRKEKMLFRSIAFVLSVYFLVGLSGYLTFPGKVQGNILLNYSLTDKLVFVARLSLSITLLCGIPLLVIPIRQILYGILKPK
jgi:sodium-coupled neutral amino acid transporter 7/8